MLLHTTGVHDLHPARTEHLARAADRGTIGSFRIALASALAGAADRLAPELRERPVLRTRAAPN